MHRRIRCTTELFSCLLALLLLGSAAQAQQFNAWSTPVNLGPLVNSSAIEGSPCISNDGLTLYFPSMRDGGYGIGDIYVSTRLDLNSPWQAPVNLGAKINTSLSELIPRLSLDEHRLFYSSVGATYDIYVSRRHNRRDNLGWTEPVKVEALSFPTSNEIAPSFFEEESTGTIFGFMSSTLSGNPDLYTFTYGEDGTIGAFVPVSELNTPYVERYGSIRRDGLELCFESNRPGSQQNDIWCATRASTFDQWSQPVNVTSLNSASIEYAPFLSKHGTEMYFISDRPGGYGTFDIYVSTRTKLSD